MRALALIDGEHYPDVVRVAFAGLGHDVAGAVLLGGTEKLRGGEDYGVPLFETLDEAFEAISPEIVVDLSDEPVADPPRRFRIASRVLARGVPYVGADFRFDPVRFEPFSRPALAVVGTGKRVGKTAVAGHIARLLSRELFVVVVAMGRGGPQEPVVVDRQPEIDELLELSRAGGHAASDYLEDAAFASVVTVGSRRAGGGLAGAPFYSNVGAAAELAASLSPDLVVFEGSGAAIPPVEVGKRVLVVGATQDPATVIGYLGAYRVLLSDLVVLTGCEEPLTDEADVEKLRRAIGEVSDVPVLQTIFRPRPVSDVSGRRVAYFSTAPQAAHARLREHLGREHGAEIVHVSGNLSRRPELRADLASLEARSADLYLVELKAAAIDVVAETAAERAVPVVLCDNEVRTVDGESLDERVLDLADALVGARA
ncbi:MAG TPA: 2,3-diphosphoglycerate synthetase [Gaiellaceae bacterium]|nr:2,3-diphosphoglycerate synthetase [Gaiellaceae bacterium]